MTEIFYEIYPIVVDFVLFNGIVAWYGISAVNFDRTSRSVDAHMLVHALLWRLVLVHLILEHLQRLRSRYLIGLGVLLLIEFRILLLLEIGIILIVDGWRVTNPVGIGLLHLRVIRLLLLVRILLKVWRGHLWLHLTVRLMLLLLLRWILGLLKVLLLQMLLLLLLLLNRVLIAVAVHLFFEFFISVFNLSGLCLVLFGLSPGLFSSSFCHLQVVKIQIQLF